MSTASTESYTVLARRFRPQTFEDVVGQSHISQSLQNAILANRVAHAYLFTGARGVGKTSTARILAKALNCPQAVDGNPCNTCEICQGVSAGNDVDVLEIDGASNRGIDDIRQLRANVNVKSMRTKFKIYIIDEVHMLTKDAFNALLKTLEEPPPNVKFVFCTTEPNKIPDTILSRVQRFDFGTIETNSIKDRLRQIAELEGVKVDDDALELVARRAAGSMRDSQSIFDQLLAFGEEHVTSGDVHRLLGTAGDDRLISIAGALVDGNRKDALDAFHAALDEGVQLGELTDQLLFYLRDLMVLSAGAESVDLMAVSPGSRSDLSEQAGRWGLQTVVAAMQILADTKGRMQRVTYGRALAELALVRISLLGELSGIDGLIEELKSGSERTGSTDSSHQKKNERLTDVGSSTADPSPVPMSTGSPIAIGIEARTSAASIQSPEQVEATAAIETGQDHAGSDRSGQVSDASRSDSAGWTPTMPESELAPTTTASHAVVKGEAESATVVETRRSEHESAEPLDLQGDASLVIAGRAEFSEENCGQFWTQVVSEITDMLKSHVKSVSKTAICAPNKLELTFPRKYHFSKRYCEKPEAIGRLEEIASRVAGRAVRVSLLLGEDPAASSNASSQKSDSRFGNQTLRRVFKPESDEFVSGVMEVFSAQCVRVEEISGAGQLSRADETELHEEV